LENRLSDLLRWLLDPSGLTPHGFCLLWEPWLIWTHALADIAIGLAYFSIPLALTVFARRRRDLVFKPVFWLFAAFILLCGAGHWLDLLTLWVPAYGVEAVVKAATGLVSVATALALWPLMPRALALPSPAGMRAANDALRDSEARHRANFIRAPLPMLVLDAQGMVTSVSDRCLDLLGYGREDILGRHVTELQPPSARHSAQEWADFLASGEVRDVERCFVRRDGGLLDVLVSATVERRPGDGEVRVIAALVDITSRKRTEAALEVSQEGLRHAQKMEAIGQLTGGIAHDFNNVLQAVSGNLELIRRRVRDDQPDVVRLANNALEAAGKAAGLTSQLLSFARRQRLDPQPLDAVEVIESMRVLLDRTAGERIALRLESEAGVSPCLADHNQLESALLNLVINARDALAGATGNLTITIGSQHVGGPSTGSLPEGDYVRIAVRDDGPGMTEAVRRRAFEPFFTTKGPGKGTGLGLAQIYGFAHQSGGTAMIDSAPGRGTEVAILLPRSAEPVHRASAPPVLATEAEAGFGETVLIVEDDALVRAALAETLRDLRYQIMEAADADTALTLLERGGAADLIFTDLSMPGSMDGLEFAAAIRMQFPHLPVILTTGHVGVLSGRTLPDGVSFVRKPHSRTGIAAAVRQALAGDQVAVQPGLLRSA
jgi:PAS domain S-box-containing protein